MSFIEFYHLDDTDLWDRIIEYFDKEANKHPGTVGGWGLKPEFKKSTDALLEGPLVNEYMVKLKECVAKYTQKYEYSSKNQARWSLWPFISIKKYNPGESYSGLHCERPTAWGHAGRRHLVFMTYLNDVNDDGETLFYYQNLKVKPRKGLTLIWPAEWTHTHCGIVSNTEVKYILTGWLSYEPHEPFRILNFTPT